MKALLFLFAISILPACAQSSKTDSLENLLAKEKTDTTKINLIFEIAMESWSTSPEKTLTGAEKVLAMSKKLDYPKGASLGEYALAVYYWQKNNYAESLLHYSKSEQISREISDHVGIAKAISSAGIVYGEQGNYAKALDNYLQALAIFNGLGDKKRSAHILNSIGNVHKNQKNYDEALSFYKQAQAIWINVSDTKSLGGSYINIATIYTRKKDYAAALASAEKGLALFEKFQDANGQIICHNNLGEIYFQTAKYTLAIQEYDQALRLNQNFQRKPAMVSSYNGLGQVYAKIGQPARALDNYHQAEVLAKANGIKPALQVAYEGLATAYGQVGNYADAFRFQKMSSFLKDSLFNEENTNRITNLRVHYENERKEAEIKLIQKEKDLGDMTRNAIMGGLMTGLTLVAFGFNRKRLEVSKNSALHAAQKALTDIEMQASQEKEQLLRSELEFRNKALTTHTLNLIQKNKILEDIRQTVSLALKTGSRDENTPLFSRLINLIDYSFNLDKDWDEFKTYFEGVHPEFFTKLKKETPELSAGELRLCALIRLNLNLKESAGLLSISPDSVKTARHRLRKKLKLGEESNLLEYMMRI